LAAASRGAAIISIKAHLFYVLNAYTIANSSPGAHRADEFQINSML